MQFTLPSGALVGKRGSPCKTFPVSSRQAMIFFCPSLHSVDLLNANLVSEKYRAECVEWAVGVVLDSHGAIACCDSLPL